MTPERLTLVLTLLGVTALLISLLCGLRAAAAVRAYYCGRRDQLTRRMDHQRFRNLDYLHGAVDQYLREQRGAR
ncbi:MULTISPECIES: hypothetical protein [Micromonospora]|uniref:Uncharacterized protein n=1 Tax=Micromonospora maris TaxID=1003110 RepID=A0A9X0I4D7_9ACTN|nr:hypothetical protein [Micromonospora maris]AEB47416.1 hypothetical protein VAB18032_01660 [Micromonospora maris AB-18-032]KUJ46492.1 hypothetical protein ADL17_26660 [Micromonospora maris]